uniref:Uncharacterized protein n=1 Tax=Oryza glumipatula TaxID=40148 RepID=A0A0E0AW96_9ORYZ
MAPERVPLLAGKLGHDERGRRHGGGLGGAVPGEHLHQPVHHRRRRADPPERGLAEPRVRRDVDEDPDAAAAARRAILLAGGRPLQRSQK